MDISYRLTRQDSHALSQALVLRAERDAIILTCVAVALAALTIALPFEATLAALPRLAIAIGAAGLAAGLTWWVTRWWIGQRSRWFPAPPVRGLEPGERRLTLALENVREISAEGERVFRWLSFAGRAETDDWIALRVSSRECLAIPRGALRKGDLGGAGPLMSLLRKGRRGG